MLEVLVQMLGPVESAPGSYDWITVNRIDNPRSLDIGYLKDEIMKLARKSEYRPNADVLRLVVRRNEITEMKIMLTDFFLKEVK